MKNKPGILAQRVVVRPYMPWQSRLLIVAIFIALLLTLSWFSYNAGVKSRIPGNESVIDEDLFRDYDLGTCLQEEKKELCAQMAGLVRQLQMKNALHEDLATQVKTLGTENGQLKEELAFFRHLTSDSNNTNPGVSIHRFDLQQGKSPGEYRYTLLLVQGGQRPKDFKGNLKFLVTLRQNETIKKVPLTSRDTSELFTVGFKFYQRIEESFQVPENAIVENLQAQLFEKGSTKVKLTQTIKPSL